jgi:pyridoxamine 5'-phosphate oxidase
MSRDLSQLRESYQRLGLHRRDLALDPISQFETWWDAWVATEPYDPAACVLATAGTNGRPSARVVLCRGVDQSGFVVYTNRTSAKGHQLAENPWAALTFAWLDLARQVRIEGPVTLVDDAESDAYWATRPRGSQLGAWASDQSAVVADRDELDRSEADVEARFGLDPSVPVPRPEWWGGYRIGVDRAEFWQGQPNRLHDRFAYTRRDDETWQIDRLSP